MSRKQIKDGLTKWERWAKNHPIEHRASRLLKNYNREDMICGRGKGDLTYQWIVDNIFSKPCTHCGKTGWEIIGCNRIDNSKPHTMDNVEPCCKECNSKMYGKDTAKEIAQIDMKTGEIIKIWPSSNEARRNGYNTCYKVANGIRNNCKGYYFKWLGVSPTS